MIPGEVGDYPAVVTAEMKQIQQRAGLAPVRVAAAGTGTGQFGLLTLSPDPVKGSNR